MVYYDRQPPPEDERPGCLDALLITRAVFGILFWPLMLMFAAVMDGTITVLLFTSYAPLALIPIAITVAGIWIFARWERTHFRPPDA